MQLLASTLNILEQPQVDSSSHGLKLCIFRMRHVLHAWVTYHRRKVSVGLAQVQSMILTTIEIDDC